MHRASVTQGRASTGADLHTQGGNDGRGRPGTCRFFRLARETCRAALFRLATRAFAERCGRGAETGARFLAAGRRSPALADLRPAPASGSPLLVCVPGLRFRPPVVAHRAS